MMPPRQLWLFKLGCWTAVAIAGVYLVVHVMTFGISATDAGRQALAMSESSRFAVIGGGTHSLADLLGAASLMFDILLAAMGAAGLAAAQTSDRVVVRGVARVFSIACVTLVIIALLDVSLVFAMLLAALSVCFILASVVSPEG
jgi:hypothetical protein